jgi:hypothetical protein
MPMMRIAAFAGLMFLGCCLTASAADIRAFSEEARFRQAVLSPTTVSFDPFAIGFLPQNTLSLGAVTVVLTNAGGAPIFGPGPFGFTTQFLSVGVQDGGTNVVINFPAGTRGGGMKLVSVLPVTVTATSVSGETQTVDSPLHRSPSSGSSPNPGLHRSGSRRLSSPSLFRSSTSETSPTRQT